MIKKGDHRSQARSNVGKGAFHCAKQKAPLPTTTTSLGPRFEKVEDDASAGGFLASAAAMERREISPRRLRYSRSESGMEDRTVKRVLDSLKKKYMAFCILVEARGAQ